MRAILIDDELDSLESLQAELNTYRPDIEILAACDDPRVGLKEIINSNPDVIFLDIEMPHLNGFELLESLNTIDFDVIFVTAYDEYAVRAFEFNAADYLLKPVMKSKLLQAIDRLDERNQRGLSKQELSALVTNLHVRGMENIALPTSDGFEFVHVNEIMFMKSESNYTWVHMATESKYLLSKTLKDMASMIAFPQFFRAHQSYLVNLNHVKKYVRGKGGYLVLRNGEHIPVSRANKEALMILLNS